MAEASVFIDSYLYYGILPQNVRNHQCLRDSLSLVSLGQLIDVSLCIVEFSFPRNVLFSLFSYRCLFNLTKVSFMSFPLWNSLYTKVTGYI